MIVGLRRAALAALIAAAMALPAHSAIVFNFSWTGDPAEDLNIVSSDDATLRAIGTITIDAAPGATFTLADIVSTNITVSGAQFADWTLTSWSSAGGTIAADGLSALFSAAGNPFFLDGAAFFFGCEGVQCGNSNMRVRGFNSVNSDILFTSQATALASMKMTVIPLPAGLPLLLGALGVLYVARRQRAGAA